MPQNFDLKTKNDALQHGSTFFPSLCYHEYGNFSEQ